MIRACDKCGHFYCDECQDEYKCDTCERRFCENCGTVTAIGYDDLCDGIGTRDNLICRECDEERTLAKDDHAERVSYFRMEPGSYRPPSP
jgi:hypothetical protein